MSSTSTNTNDDVDDSDDKDTAETSSGDTTIDHETAKKISDDDDLPA